MAINVQHGGAMPLLEFLAGFSAKRQQKKFQQAQQQTQQNQQLGQSLGQGLGNAVQGYVARSNQLQDAATNQGYDLAKIAAHDQGAMALQKTAFANQQALQTQRDATDTYQRAASDYAQIHKELPNLDPNQFNADPIQFELPGANMTDAATGMPVNAQAQQDPSAVPSPTFNPGMTRQYRNAQQELIKLRDQRHLASIDPNMAPVDRQARVQAYDQAIAQQTSIASRYPAPKPPTSWAELEQAGPHNGGFARDPVSGAMLVPKGFTIHDPAGKPAANAPVTYTDQNGNVVQAQGDFGYLPDGRMWTKGGIKIEETKSGGNGGDSFAGPKEIASAYDKLSKDLQGKDTDNNVTPADPKLVAEAVQKRDVGIKEAMIKTKRLEPLVQEITDLAREIAREKNDTGESDLLKVTRLAALKREFDRAMNE